MKKLAKDQGGKFKVILLLLCVLGSSAIRINAQENKRTILKEKYGLAAVPVSEINAGVLDNERVTVVGVAGDLIAEGMGQTTHLYWIVDDWGDRVRVRTAEPPDQLRIYYEVTGIVARDEQGRYLIEQDRKLPSKGTSNAAGRETETVSVKVCAKSGKLPQKFCPIETRKFPKGAAPKEYCPIFFHRVPMVPFGLGVALIVAAIGIAIFSLAKKKPAQPAPSGPTVAMPDASKVGQTSQLQAAASKTLVSWGMLEGIEGSSKGERFPLSERLTKIGRDNGDVKFPNDKTVSREHADIILSPEGKLKYVDHSTNGSKINGKLLHQGEVELKSGDTIEIGSQKLKLVVTSTAGPAAGAASATRVVSTGGGAKEAPATRQFLGAELEVISGPAAGKKFPVAKPLIVIGRVPEADVRVDDDTVSRRQAELRVEGGKFILRNLSQYGTRVNGVTIVEKDLHSGDEITMGSSVLKFVKM